ncbi:polysaccharide deacetylase family protein [Halalkalibacter urbisdiaboli]|uniref:polysaccharide deacetylase family protein n=1 Tax=Halalkalibacter urbisdiaboli TaxID=1960589 RepID=UPI000B42E69D|nr:polysaccharide deacetylase family protein [Halalkalibacter urbisdiaboli]
MSTVLIHEIKTSQKAVAFTFDDGPNPLYTLQVLTIFQEVSGKATFYMIGEQMIKHPEIVKKVIDQNHEIGNHTFTHPMLTQMRLDDCLHEITKTDKLIKDMTGEAPTTFRPPYFDFNEFISSEIKELGYKVIGALNIDALDWEQPGVNHIVTKTRNHIKNGSILLFHDGFGDRSQTIEAVRTLVYELKEQGYQFVTVSELLQLANREN